MGAQIFVFRLVVVVHVVVIAYAPEFRLYRGEIDVIGKSYAVGRKNMVTAQTELEVHARGSLEI